MGSRSVTIAGAGIAGLTAALAFAARGFDVLVVERAAQLDEAGAGLQLSPNATRILDRLGVLEKLLPVATRPEAVLLRDAKSLAALARIPMGEAAERSWKAPYLVLHRADLQQALLSRVRQESRIELLLDAEIADVTARTGGITASINREGVVAEMTSTLVVGADGVRSAMRRHAGSAKSRFSGQIAWRNTVPAASEAGRIILQLGAVDSVAAHLAPGFHLIVYPVRGGTAFNLVAFTADKSAPETLPRMFDAAALKSAMGKTALARLAEAAGPWTAWPIHSVDPGPRWTAPAGIALIGDAAHAMTPFAAQGAAMAIEDAETLAASVAAAPSAIAGALAAWEHERRPRIARVARRGAINHLAWHAAGPVAAARNLFLKMRSPESLAADLDWLYGWEPPDS